MNRNCFTLYSLKCFTNCHCKAFVKKRRFIDKQQAENSIQDFQLVIVNICTKLNF